MDANAQSCKVEDEHEPTVGARFVGLLFPFEDEPEDEGGEHGAIGIHFAFDGGEPEGVAPCVGQCRCHTACHDDEGVAGGDFRGVVVDDEAAYQVCDAPEEEEDAECGEDGRHDVDHQRYLRVVGGKMAEEVAGKHEERCAGGMSHLKTRRRGGELRTVPEGCRRLHREDVGDGGHEEYHPAYEVVNQTETLHFLFFQGCLLFMVFWFFLVFVYGGKIRQHLLRTKSWGGCLHAEGGVSGLCVPCGKILRRW